MCFDISDKDLIKDKIKIFTSEECKKTAIFLTENNIIFDKNNFKLAKFIRDNFNFFEVKLLKYTDKRLDFIFNLLTNLGVDCTKETINTTYIRVKKETI